MRINHLSTDSSLPPRVPGKICFYTMRFCPFSHRVRFILDAKNIPYDEVYVNLIAKPKWLFDINPTGNVPCIVLENNEILYESLIIADYLNEVYPNNNLYPTDPLQKAKDKLIIERFGEIILKMHQFFVNKMTNQKPFHESLDALEYLEKELEKRGTRFIGGNQPQMVDLMIWPWFERADVIRIMKKPQFVIPEERFKRLLSWTIAMKSIPIVKNYYLKPEIHAKYIESYASGTPQYDII